MFINFEDAAFEVRLFGWRKGINGSTRITEDPKINYWLPVAREKDDIHGKSGVTYDNGYMFSSRPVRL